MRAAYILPALALIVLAVLSSLFIVDEREKVLVLQFGQVKQVKENPAWGLKSRCCKKLCAMTAASWGCRHRRWK